MSSQSQNAIESPSDFSGGRGDVLWMRVLPGGEGVTGGGLKAAGVPNSTDCTPPAGSLGSVLPPTTFLQTPTRLAPRSLVEMEE